MGRGLLHYVVIFHSQNKTETVGRDKGYIDGEMFKGGNLQNTNFLNPLLQSTSRRPLAISNKRRGGEEEQ